MQKLIISLDIVKIFSLNELMNGVGLKTNDGNNIADVGYYQENICLAWYLEEVQHF